MERYLCCRHAVYGIWYRGLRLYIVTSLIMINSTQLLVFLLSCDVAFVSYDISLISLVLKNLPRHRGQQLPDAPATVDFDARRFNQY